MNTLDDLRTTLDRHASVLPDDALHARAGAVRGRVRVVRRRRRVAAAGAAAAVVAAVALGTQLVRPGPAPVADRTLAGHTAPRTMTSLGYTYSFARGVQGDGRATLRLAASDAPRLVSWATAGSDDEVTVRRSGEAARTMTTGDFGDFVLVPESGGTVRVAGSGRVALAAYDLSRPAPGDTVDGITFREDVAGKRLLGDVVGEAGQADVAVTVSRGPGTLPISWVCTGGPRDAWVHISSGDGVISSGHGCDDSTFDPGGNGGVEVGAGATPSGRVHLRLWATRGEHGPRVDDPDLRLALAAYAPAPAVERLAGWPVPATTEFGGHVWKLLRTSRTSSGEREIQTRGSRDGRATLVVMNFDESGRGSVQSLRNGRPDGGQFDAGGAGSTQGLIPASGGSVGLRAAEPRSGGRVELGLAEYVRAD